MDRRRFLKTAAGLFVPAAPALILPAAAQGPVLPGPGLPVAAAGLGLQTNLGSFFSLDNTLNDATGNVSALTNNNAVTFVSPPGGGLAAVSQCANFVAASSQYLSHADATGINVVGVDFSIQFWFYSTNNTVYIASKNSGAFGSREYAVQRTFGTGATNPVSFIANDSGGLATPNNSNGAWHHCVITRDVTTKAQIIYIDGVSAVSNTGNINPAGTSQLNIGASGAPGGYFGGNIALYGTWRNRILTAGDVTLLYNGGAGLSYAGML